MTILMGVVANYPLALATGLGLNAFVAFSIASADDLGRRHGPRRPRGPHHPRAGAHRLPEGGLPRRARPSSRSRSPSASACSSRSSASSTPGFVRRTGAGPVPGRARHRRPARRLADRSSSSSAWCCVIALWVRKVKGAILISIVATTVLAIIVEAIAKVGPTVDATTRSTRPAGASTCPTLPDKIVDVPDFGTARPVHPARLVRARSASSRPCCSSSR